MKTFLIITVSCAFVLGLFVVADHREKSLLRIAECVESRANADGHIYAYGETAWKVYASECAE